MLVESCAGAFEGVAAAPEGSRQRPGNLAIGPSFRIVQPYAAYERAGLTLFHSPHPKATQMPVASQHRHLPPGILAIQDAAIPDVPHYFGISAQRSVRVEIRIAKRPKP
jgi:hypothetical protein